MTEIKKNNPIDTDADPSPKPGARRLRRYWTRGKGAAKIRWGTAGDFNRCVRHLRKYVTDPKGLCNVYHVAAVGAPPGQGHPGGKSFEDSITLKETLIFAESLKQLDCSPLLNLLNETEETKDDMQNLEQKQLADDSPAVGLTEVKEDGVVEALVSVTGIVDNVNDIIVPGAYEKTLKARTPKGVWSHDWNTPVSKVLDIKELMPGDPALPTTLANGSPWPAEAGALYVKAQFNLDTQRGRDAYADVKFFSDQAEWSIGYNVPKGASEKGENGERLIKELNLFEYSPVLFGAASNARSLVSAAKSLFESDPEFRKEVKDAVEGEGVEIAGNGTNENECTCGHEDQSADPDKIEEIGQSETERSDDLDAQPNPSHEDGADAEARAVNAEVPLTAESIKQIKSLHDELGAILGLINVKKVEPTFDENKSLRSAMDTLVKGHFDSGIVEAIENNVEALEVALKANDVEAIRDNADDALDEIAIALSDPKTDDEAVSQLKALVAAIGKALKDADTVDTTADISDTETVSEEIVEDHKSIVLSAEELKSLLTID